jgi:glycosyltransferase involved in cell wall biosynthesis
MKIFDDAYPIEKINFIYLGKSGAGYRDMARLQQKYPQALFFYKWESVLGIKSWAKELMSNRINVYVHSSPFNLIPVIFACNNTHYLFVHNPPRFESRKSVYNLIDQIILIANLSLIKGKIFLTSSVYEKYKNSEYKYMLSKAPFAKKSETIKISNKVPCVLFFGRYLEYKNIDAFFNLAIKNPSIKFSAYSEGCPQISLENLKVNSKWLSEKEVDEVFKESDILVLPYREVSQSGPFFLGIEKGLKIVVPNLPGFTEHAQGNPGIYFYNPNDPAGLDNAFLDAVENLKTAI